MCSEECAEAKTALELVEIRLAGLHLHHDNGHCKSSLSLLAISDEI